MSSSTDVASGNAQVTQASAEQNRDQGSGGGSTPNLAEQVLQRIERSAHNISVNVSNGSAAVPRFTQK